MVMSIQPYWKVCPGCGQSFDVTRGYGEHTSCYNEIAAKSRPAHVRKRRAWDKQRGKVAPGIFEEQGEECANCGAQDDLTIDHILPLSKGGTNDPENLQVLCLTCNTSKGNR